MTTLRKLPMTAPNTPAITYPKIGGTRFRSGIELFSHRFTRMIQIKLNRMIRVIRGLLFLFFPEHQILQERMMRGEARNRKACESVSKTTKQKQTAKEHHWSSRSDAEN